MAIKNTSVVTCDVCGKEITGDYMTVEIDGEDFQVCQPRTAPINRCGNVASILAFDEHMERSVLYFTETAENSTMCAPRSSVPYFL